MSLFHLWEKSCKHCVNIPCREWNHPRPTGKYDSTTKPHSNSAIRLFYVTKVPFSMIPKGFWMPSIHLWEKCCRHSVTIPCGDEPPETQCGIWFGHQTSLKHGDMLIRDSQGTWLNDPQRVLKVIYWPWRKVPQTLFLLSFLDSVRSLEGMSCGVGSSGQCASAY